MDGTKTMTAVKILFLVLVFMKITPTPSIGQLAFTGCVIVEILV